MPAVGGGRSASRAPLNRPYGRSRSCRYGIGPGYRCWGGNIKAHPEIVLQDGTEAKEYTAREVDGAERAEWWERAVAAFPNYAEYQEKTDRLIPLFVLDPK
ncbi:nitroreductase/quinone reductase family protein [Lentzea sp. HUAS TT2]|uniref:nitroreductase/quinone reductase family protein n=1 Tax=Lentzea sp. HUAS TT2 TaxID=3447454 RepID=UPI003F70B855